MFRRLITLLRLGLPLGVTVTALLTLALGLYVPVGLTGREDLRGYLAAIATFGIAAVVFGAWARWEKRLEPGTCRACGYDLRATPDAGGPTLAACPECGRPTGRDA